MIHILLNFLKTLNQILSGFSLLLLLKILGCILLGLLLLLLVVLLIVFFAPIRYKFNGSFHGQPEVMGKISWLFGMIKLRISFADKHPRVWVTALWFRVFDTDKPKDAEEIQDIGEEIVTFAEEKGESLIADTNRALGDMEKAPGVLPKLESEPNPEENVPKSKKEKRERRKNPKKEKITRIKKPKGPGLIERLQSKWQQLTQKYEKLEHKKEMAERIWQAECTQKTVAFVKRVLLSILKGLSPKRMSGDILFGMEKPSDTGKILGYVSILYPWYCDKLVITPDFERAIIEGDLNMQGSFQIALFASWALRGVLNKHVRKFIKYIMYIKSKEETLWQ